MKQEQRLSEGCVYNIDLACEIFINKLTFFPISDERMVWYMCYTSSGNLPKNNMIDTKKQKTLLPTLKESQRYIVYSINIPSNAQISRLNEEIIKECNSLLGVFDAGKAGIMNVKYDEKTRKGIMRVENKFLDKTKVCLGMITTIQDKKLNIDCIYVSGMINKADDILKKEHKIMTITRGVKNE